MTWRTNRLADLNIGPVVTVLPREYMRKVMAQTNGNYVETLAEYKESLNALPPHTPAGLKIAICPVTFVENTRCATCVACAKPSQAVIGFTARGARFKTVDRITATS
ncbi:MAG: hypothetical protein WCJ64_26050 [Rhodospirillaceae bacterium]